MGLKHIPGKPAAIQALEATNRERNEDYGTPESNMQLTADLWSPILGIEVTPEQVALCMVQVKIARECHSHKLDNIADAIGYLDVLERVLYGEHMSGEVREDLLVFARTMGEDAPFVKLPKEGCKLGYNREPETEKGVVE